MSDTSEDPLGASSPEQEQYSCWNLLADRLGEVSSLGDIATISRYSRAVNPILEVNDTMIPLPLTQRDAQNVKETCRLAPFGRGNETVVDPSVRRTWELNTDQFTIANAEWDSFLGEILEDACRALGARGAGYSNVVAHLHKLLLYEKGSFFKPHKDSEKEKGMVATMVVCLPSEHTGGDVHIRHGTQRHTLTTSTLSISTTTALAWYSDVTHEVSEVTSGYRLALVYNLVQQSGTPVSAGLFDRNFAEIKRALEYCQQEIRGGSTERLYVLDHKYSETSLCFSNLKGRDWAVCQYLARHCSENGFYLLLANLARIEERDVDEPGEESIELTVKHMRAGDGSELARGFQFEEDMLLNNPYHENRGEDEFQESEHLGNEESPEIFRYYDAALMLCSKDLLAQYLSHPGNIQMQNMIGMVIEDLREHPNAEGQHHALDFLRQVLSRSGFYALNFDPIIEWAQDNDEEMVKMSLNADIRRGRFSKAMKTLAKKVQDCDAAEEPWDKCLGDYLGAFPQPDDLCQGLSLFGESIPASLQTSFTCWKLDTLWRTLEAQNALTLEVNVKNCLMTLAGANAADGSSFQTRLLPLLSDCATRGFVIDLLKDILDQRGTWASILADMDRRALALEILKSTKPHASLQTKDLVSRQSEPPLYGMGTRLTAMWSEVPEDQLREIITTSWTNIQAAHTKSSDRPLVASIVENFLEELHSVLMKRNILSEMESLKALYELLIRRYRYEPPPEYPVKGEVGWRLSPVGSCGTADCEKCEPLRTFLMSEEESTTFTMEKAVYWHCRTIVPVDLVKETREVLPESESGNNGPIYFSWTVNKKLTATDILFTRELSRYEGQLRRMESKMRGYRGEYTRALLGDGLYRELVLLDNWRDSEGWKEKAAAARLASGPGDGSRKRKRGAVLEENDGQ